MKKELILDASRKPAKEEDITYIGCGINLYESSELSSERLKSRVFDPGDEVYFFTKETDIPKYVTSFKLSSISKSINASLGISAQVGKFTGDISGKFNMSEDSSEESCYTYVTYLYCKGYERLDNSDIESIKKILTPGFKDMIDNPNYDPEQVVSSFGTHVISNGPVHGARFNFYVTQSTTSGQKSKDIQASLKANIFKFDVKGDFSMDDSAKKIAKDMQCSFSQCGGHVNTTGLGSVFEPSQMVPAFLAWKESLECKVEKEVKDADGKVVIIKEVDPALKAERSEELVKLGDFYGIWEFAADKERRDAIKKYIDDYAAEIEKKSLESVTESDKPDDIATSGNGDITETTSEAIGDITKEI